MSKSDQRNIEPIKQVPKMTDETWELLEFRLWEKIKNKLWRLVGIFLTVITIGGLLGVNSFIDSRINRQVKQEKERLAKYEKELLERNLQLTQFSKLIAQLSKVLNHDREVFHLLIKDIRLASDTLNLNKEKLDGFLNNMDGFWFNQNEYPEMITSLTKILENDESEVKTQKSDTLTREVWQKFQIAVENNGIDLISTSVDLYAHILSFEKVLDKAIANQLKEYLTDPNLKGQLQELYEKEFGESYAEEWKKFQPWGGFSLSSGKYGWGNLPGLGRNAFVKEEYLIQGDDKPVF